MAPTGGNQASSDFPTPSFKAAVRTPAVFLPQASPASPSPTPRASILNYTTARSQVQPVISTSCLLKRLPRPTHAGHLPSALLGREPTIPQGGWTEIHPRSKYRMSAINLVTKQPASSHQSQTS